MLFGDLSRRDRTLVNKEIYKEYSLHKRLIRRIKKFLGKKNDNSSVARVINYARLLYYSKLKKATKN